VEKSLELLDKVLLEFEEQENTAAGEPESPSQGHQSEDDGYMSMNGRRYFIGKKIIEMCKPLRNILFNNFPQYQFTLLLIKNSIKKFSM
jgi:hypothetical protein